MRELQTTRVVIIDDDAREGEGLRDALAEGGIPSLVFAGEDDLPSVPLTGVRLAALDADFADQYGTQPDDVVTDPTAGMVAGLLAAENGPYHALIWTKHPGLAESLEEKLADRGFPAAAYTMLAKEEVRLGEGWDVPKILQRIEQDRSGQLGLRFLSEWERAVFDAGVATVGDLFQGETDTEVLRALSYVEREQASAEQKLRAVAEALSRLHADALDRRPGKYTEEVFDPLFGGESKAPTEERRAQLHARLLLGTASPGASPGSIYLLDAIARRLRRPKWFPSIELITRDFGGESDRLEDLETTPVAVEVTPLCDEHRETRIARFLVGVAVSVGETSNTKRDRLRGLKSQAFRNDGPMIVPGLGHVDIVWCARLAFTSPIEPVRTLMPISRLRYDVLVDLQSWSSAQASRPGYLSIST